VEAIAAKADMKFENEIKIHTYLRSLPQMKEQKSRGVDGS